MIGETYKFTFSDYFPKDDMLLFVFVSTGLKDIEKVVCYSPSDLYGARYYTLGFGDLEVDFETEKFLMNDRVESNNGDTNKVLYTVISTIRPFFEIHPDAYLRIVGSNDQRSRIYVGLIARHIRHIEPEYFVEGVCEGAREKFDIGKRYEYIIISLKKDNYEN